jgi:hypothetical protein
VTGTGRTLTRGVTRTGPTLTGRLNGTALTWEVLSLNGLL